MRYSNYLIIAITILAIGIYSMVHAQVSVTVTTNTVTANDRKLHYTACKSNMDYEQDYRLIRQLIDAGANVNHKDNDTALTCAVKYGRTMLVEMLLDWGADIELSGGKFGMPPLSTAVWKHRNKIAKTLIDRGASIYSRDDHRDTALHNAAWFNNHHAIAILREAAGDDWRVYMEIENRKEQTALDYAYEQDHKRVKDILIKDGATNRVFNDDSSILGLVFWILVILTVIFALYFLFSPFMSKRRPRRVKLNVDAGESYSYIKENSRIIRKKKKKNPIERAFAELGLNKHATVDEIQNRFKVLGTKYSHSDERYIRLCQAYELLLRNGYCTVSPVQLALDALGLNDDAEPDDIRNRYHELARKYHTDNKSTGDSNKFLEITAAYEVLEENGLLRKKNLQS